MLRYLRSIRLYWPPADFCMANEWAREFHLDLPFVSIRLFALDNVRHPLVRMRCRFIHFGWAV